MPRHFFDGFELELRDALRDQLTVLLDDMSHGPLEETTVRTQIPEAQGVYQLFLDEELVYVGKTDAAAGLQKRLLRHSRKIHSRVGLDHGRVTFKAVRVYVFTTVDLEELLIDHYKGVGAPMSWQHSGFGSNDPGRRRDTSIPGSFDSNFPINLDIAVGVSSPATAASLLQELKNKLAYTVRFEGDSAASRNPHPDLVRTDVSLRQERDSVREILRQIARALGPAWQITALPGYVIVYRENRRYDAGTVLRP